jgi:hypothetical protein
MMIAISFFIFLWMIATKATEKKKNPKKKYMLVRGDWQSADAKKTKAPLSRKL